jgi:glucuronokinase
MIEGIAFARAGLLGNPSDGYGGKVLAVAVRNFSARVKLEESRRLTFIPSAGDEESYPSVAEFEERVGLYGYYGSLRLIKAAFRTFCAHCRENGIARPERPFAAWAESGIPRQIGLGGSSAIVTAAMRAFMAYYEVEIPVEVQPSLILSAERDELDINAGLQDRVAQVYEGCVYMNFDPEILERAGSGRYERIDAALLPPLYLAYKPSLGKVSGRVLNEIRAKFDKGDAHTVATLQKLAGLAERGRDAILGRDWDTLHGLMNENFDLRRSIMTISPANLELVEAARRTGASAKFAGSGGSIIGTFRSESQFAELAEKLPRIGAVVIRPILGRTISQ